MKQKAHGFTIVELLIVIVVIAILAAISMVTYSSISAKANVSKKMSDVTSIRKQLDLYKVEHGSTHHPYPGFSNLYAPDGAPSGFDKISLPEGIKDRFVSCLQAEAINWDKCHGDAGAIDRNSYIMLAGFQSSFLLVIWHDVDRVWRVVDQTPSDWPHTGDACSGMGNLCDFDYVQGESMPCSRSTPVPSGDEEDFGCS